MSNLKVSVIVASYNPNLKKMYLTLRSIIIQQDIETEIIIADDGSKENRFQEIESFFRRYNYSQFILVGTDNNRGTVNNVLHALSFAKNEIIKLISPGDCLCEKTTLNKWASAFSESGKDISFGKAVFYSVQDHNVLVYPELSTPNDTSLYYNNADGRSIMKHYMFYDDPISGAVILLKKEICYTYLKLLSNRIKYCEDYLIKLHLLESNDLYFFDEYVVLYEYGAGVSSNPQWSQRMKTDMQSMATLILNNKRYRKVVGLRGREILKYRSKQGFLPKWRFLLYPSMFLRKMRNKKIHYSPIKIDCNLISTFMNGDD